MTRLVTSWACPTCGTTDTGDPTAIDRAADKHTRTTQHPTRTWTRPEEPTPCPAPAPTSASATATTATSAPAP